MGAVLPSASRLALTSTVFALVYTLCNHYTGTRVDIGAAIFEWEHAIPFVPWTIVPYLSIVVFFALSFFVGRDPAALHEHVARLLVDLALSVGCYLLFPLRFQFERPPLEGPCGALFMLLAACDLPYNRAPSLHISALLLLWLRLAPFTTGLARLALQGWFVLIGLSVLTTWQHHLIDVPAGLAAGAASIWLVRQRARLARLARLAPATLLALLVGCADRPDGRSLPTPVVPPACAEERPAAVVGVERAAPAVTVAPVARTRDVSPAAAPHAEPIDHAARTKAALYLRRDEAERMDRALNGGVVWLDAACCSDDDFDLVTLLAYGEQAARNLGPKTPLFVTGGDQRLAARLVDRLGRAGIGNAYLVTP